MSKFNGKIEVVGLGAGDMEQLPLGVYRKLTSGQVIFLRTMEHPLIDKLKMEGCHFHSFDACYEKHEHFSAVYEEICDTLLKKATGTSIIYAVPGHPMVAEKTVQLLLERGRAAGISVELGGGQSFIDALFQAVKIDPIEGFQLLDGTDLHQEQIQIKQHIVIAQVYDAFVASHVKLTLMEKLPDDYEVFIITAAGSMAEQVRKIPLYELDRQVIQNNLTTVYVPPVTEEELLYKEFSKLREIIATLRGPDGCPWDKKQTHHSLKPYLIEETYELIEAIDEGDVDHLIEEIGDVLLQVMLHAQIGEEDGYFTINDVIETLSQKMIRRHPHVFGDLVANNEETVNQYWEQIKRQENDAEPKQSLLAKVNVAAPNLMRALEIQKRAAKVGFDWQEVVPALEKVQEELEEFQLEIARSKQNNKNLQMEFGDVLFALVNVARFFRIDPEEALFQANAKFIRRFTYIEGRVEELKRPWVDFTLEELDIFWEEAKQKGL